MQAKPLASRSVVVADASVVVEILPETGADGAFGLAAFPPIDLVVALGSGLRRLVSRQRRREDLVVRVSLDGRTLWERTVRGRAAADAEARTVERALSQGGLSALAGLPS